MKKENETVIEKFEKLDREALYVKCFLRHRRNAYRASRVRNLLYILAMVSATIALWYPALILTAIIIFTSGIWCDSYARTESLAAELTGKDITDLTTTKNLLSIAQKLKDGEENGKD